MSSTSFNRTLFADGLKAAQKYLATEALTAGSLPDLVWNASDQYPEREWQLKLLRSNRRLGSDLDSLLGHKTYVHADPAKVNDWFESQPSRFPRLIPEKPVDPMVFFVGMVYALRNLSWMGGDAETYDYENRSRYSLTDKEKPGFALTVGKNGAGFFDAGLPDPVVLLPTFDTEANRVSRIAVMLWFSDKSEEWDLTNNAQNIADYFAESTPVDVYGGVVLPNVVSEVKMKLGEGKMKGLWTTAYDGRRVRVEDAGMFLRNVLSPEGPLSEGAAYMEMRKELAMMEERSKPFLRFDRPFSFAFVDMGLSRPTVYTATWVDVDGMSDTEISLSQFGVS